MFATIHGLSLVGAVRDCSSPNQYWLVLAARSPAAKTTQRRRLATAGLESAGRSRTAVGKQPRLAKLLASENYRINGKSAGACTREEDQVCPRPDDGSAASRASGAHSHCAGARRKKWGNRGQHFCQSVAI